MACVHPSVATVARWPVRPDDLLASVVRALVARNPFEVRDYEDLIAGCSSQAGEDGRNLARHVALLSGLPTAVGGLTVNRLCGSGLAAVLDAARAVRCGEGELFIAGGVESMSRAPFVVAKATSAWSVTSMSTTAPSEHAFPTRR
jgi:acetyl-CoA C-acetyltransferase